MPTSRGGAIEFGLLFNWLSSGAKFLGCGVLYALDSNHMQTFFAGITCIICTVQSALVIVGIEARVPTEPLSCVDIDVVNFRVETHLILFILH
jgi:hypothetical protein